MRLRGGHGTVVALFVELLDFVFLCETAADSEGSVEGGLVAAVASLSAIH